MKYISSGLIAFYTKLSYRGNFVIALVTKGMQLALSSFMWIAIYHYGANESIRGFTVAQMLVYLGVINLLSLVFDFSPIFRLGNLIHNGQLTTYLIRPINIFIQGLFQYIGNEAFYIFAFLCISFYFVKSEYSSWASIILIFIFIVCTYLMFYTCISCIALTSFWLVQVWPLRPVLTALFLLLGGQYFPLKVLPLELYNVVRWSPFSLAGNTLSTILLGHVDGVRILENILVSLGWLLFFMIVYKFGWKCGLNKYMGVGI
ncbi:ABC transporter permease [Pediococcus parvulus]|uniref:ABC transporter permease n=2 Tax=Pediococcus parvulus TaxID=54062 RepID=UPI0037578E7E